MTVRIAHFTDIHVTARPAEIGWRSLFGKRAVGWANLRFFGRGAAFAESEAIVRAFVEDLRSQEPHHVLFTGDLTGLSLPLEFERAHELLAPVLESYACTGIPGNHDVYTRGALRARLYEEWFGTWRAGVAGSSAPVVRLVRDVAAIVAVEDVRPTGWHDSSGRIGSKQLARLETLLSSPELEGRRVIVALHYGPLLPSGLPDTRLHGLRDWAEFLAIVDRAAVDLVVHGHLHARAFLPRSDRRPVPLTTPGSLTHSGHERAYHVYHCDPGGVRIEARRFAAATRRFEPWPNAPGAGLLPRLHA